MKNGSKCKGCERSNGNGRDLCDPCDVVFAAEYAAYLDARAAEAAEYDTLRFKDPR